MDGRTGCTERRPAISDVLLGRARHLPPLGALADSVGGLTAARILSLCFILAPRPCSGDCEPPLRQARGLLRRRIVGFPRADPEARRVRHIRPMSVFLVALSVWCAVHGVRRQDFTRWIAASAAALILANAAAYSSAIFDPVVVAIAFLATDHEQSLKLAKMRAAALATYVISVLILLADAGGGFYWTGISETVLSRTHGTTPASTVLITAWQWVDPSQS